MQKSKNSENKIFFFEKRLDKSLNMCYYIVVKEIMYKSREFLKDKSSFLFILYIYKVWSFLSKLIRETHTYFFMCFSIYTKNALHIINLQHPGCGSLLSALLDKCS